MKILNKNDIFELRETIKAKYKEKIDFFESYLIQEINKKIKLKVGLNNEGTKLKEDILIKINLSETKFLINDLYQELLKKGESILAESELLESLTIKLQDNRYRGAVYYETSQNRIIEAVAKDLPELSLIVSVEINI